jgi:hypothetical protein
MKKQIFTIIILLMGGVSAFGQFKFDGGVNSVRLQTNGVDRLYVTPNGVAAPALPGNVGIGTIQPPAKLTVVGDMALQKIQRETVSGGYNDYDRQEASIVIFENGGTIGGIQGGSKGQMLYVLCGYGINQSALVIKHESSGNPTVANRILTHTGADFTITAGAGGVLLIYDDIKARWRIVETPSGSGTAGWGLTGNAGTNPATQFIGTTDAQPLAFKTNNTERMNISNIGNVGIGVAPNANSRLVISKGVSGVTPGSNISTVIEDNVAHYVGIFSPNATETGILFGTPSGSGNNTGLISTATSDIKLTTNASTKMIVLNNGNVGIGTVSPDAKLDVNGDFRLSNKLSLNLGTYNNLNRSGASVIKAQNGGTITISGIAGGVDGMILYIYAQGGTSITLLEDNVGSSVGNRISTGFGSNLGITNGGGATLIYDSDGYWRVIGVNQ